MAAAARAEPHGKWSLAPRWPRRGARWELRLGALRPRPARRGPGAAAGGDSHGRGQRRPRAAPAAGVRSAGPPRGCAGWVPTAGSAPQLLARCSAAAGPAQPQPLGGLWVQSAPRVPSRSLAPALPVLCRTAGTAAAGPAWPGRTGADPALLPGAAVPKPLHMSHRCSGSGLSRRWVCLAALQLAPAFGSPETCCWLQLGRNRVSAELLPAPSEGQCLGELRAELHPRGCGASSPPAKLVKEEEVTLRNFCGHS